MALEWGLLILCLIYFGDNVCSKCISHEAKKETCVFKLKILLTIVFMREILLNILSIDSKKGRILQTAL